VASHTGSMQFEPGHSEGSRTVHFTHTTLVAEALCGEEVGFHGEPDLAVICVDCFELATPHGIDVAWLRESTVTVQFSLAA
jgi:hypothetical protein